MTYSTEDAAADESNLLAGSAPDDEEPDDSRQHQSRGGVPDGTRFGTSHIDAAVFHPHNHQKYQQVVNAGHYGGGDGLFTPSFSKYARHDGSANGFRTADGNSGLNGGSPDPKSTAFARSGKMTFGRPAEFHSGLNAASPTSGTSSRRGFLDPLVDGFPASSDRALHDTAQSLRALSFGEGQVTGDGQMAVDDSRSAPAATPRHSSLSQVPKYGTDSRTAFDRSRRRLEPERSSMDIPSPRIPPHTQDLGHRLNPQAAPLQYYPPPSSGRGRGALSPMASEHRANGASPFYSATGTPPTGPESAQSTPGSGVSSRTTSHHDVVLLDRKLRGLQYHPYDPVSVPANALQSHLALPYDPSAPGMGMRVNALANPYFLPGYPSLANYSSAPRLPIREAEPSPIIRSPLLEEFRMNNKTHRRFELRDIYGHMVEFSGDQHGSRFIQQKLETANSDEKEQVFKEIQPNLLQLMTDVFGNYVIQKMFEHGSQAQKKALAHQMKGHVLHLSMQMYGCRVVQKAFEHVLTDQQASMVKELDGPSAQILKVVRDQNGNHVVQKAIERVPGEYIQFIVDAHKGQVAKMSTHQYGCRVIQRMLEHCQPAAKRVILDELLESILPLITDSYGNYVVQHIIQNGDRQDRRQVIAIVLQQLLTFSKHKFASNIVEKSIDFADDDQRRDILRGLTAATEQGLTPVLGLMRDQYGNYVLRTLHLPPM